MSEQIQPHISDNERAQHNIIAESDAIDIPDLTWGEDTEPEEEIDTTTTQSKEMDPGKRKKVEKYLRVATAFLAGAIMLPSIGCASSEEYSEQMVQKEITYNGLDEEAREQIIKNGGTKEEADYITNSEEYRKIREEITSEESNPVDFIEWLEQKRKGPFHTENEFAEENFRANNPESVGYEAHEIENPGRASLFEEILQAFPTNWKENVERMITGPTRTVPYNNLIQILRSGQLPVSRSEFLVAIDELNPGILSRMQKDEVDDLQSIVIPDMERLKQAPEFNQGLIEHLMQKTQSVETKDGDTFWGIRSRTNMESVNMDDYCESIRRLNPGYNFGDDGLTIQPNMTLIVPAE